MMADRDFVNLAMDDEVRAWLDHDAEHLEHVNIEAVSNALLDAGVLPYSVNSNDRYDLVRDTVEAFDDREH